MARTKKERHEMIEDYTKLIKAKAGVLYLEGAPGTAKTAIAEAIAEKEDWQYFQFILSQVDSADVAGIPHKHEVEGQVCTVRTVPDWAILANKKPTLVNFDELNRAPLECRNAALQILNERRVGNYKLNDDVYFISTGNIGEDGNRSDGAEVEEMDSALWGRLIYMPHDMPYITWKKMYGQNNIWNEVIAFLDSKSEYFVKQFENSKMNANPRTWTNFSKFICATSDDYEERIVLSNKFAKNFIGPSIASAFNQYLEEKQLININSVLNEWNRVGETVKKFDRSRHSQLIAELDKKDIAKLNKTQTNNLVKFLDIIDPDERAKVLMDHVIEKFESLMSSDEDFSDKIADFIRDGHDTSEVWNLKIKKADKVFFFFIVKYWSIIHNYLMANTEEKND